MVLHKIAISPCPGGKEWQGWCYNTQCDWQCEGTYEEVQQMVNKHRTSDDF